MNQRIFLGVMSVILTSGYFDHMYAYTYIEYDKDMDDVPTCDVVLDERSKKLRSGRTILFPGTFEKDAICSSGVVTSRGLRIRRNETESITLSSFGELCKGPEGARLVIVECKIGDRVAYHVYDASVSLEVGQPDPTSAQPIIKTM